MATAILRGDKTRFVNEYLTKNPHGNLRSINEAWAAGGKTGTISKAVVDKTRAKLRLTGNLRKKAMRSAKTKAFPKRSRRSTTTPGKSSFVKEFLHDHPQATAREVNEAWTTAGMQGTISHPVISEVRKGLGLIGRAFATTRKQAPRKTAPASKRPGQKPATGIRATTSLVTEIREQNSSRTAILLTVESEIDRLLFAVMSLGDLPEIETALRDARRKVCKSIPT